MLGVAEGLAPPRRPEPAWSVQEGAPLPQTSAARLSETMAARVVALGIDLGTTSVKAALVEAVPGDPSGFAVLASCARAARAEAAQSAAAGPQVRQRPGAAPPRGGEPLSCSSKEAPSTALFLKKSPCFL